MGTGRDRNKKTEANTQKRRVRSEDLFRKKDSDNREERPSLTGYQPLKKENPAFRETLRLENSRGTLAFGGDEKRNLTLLATEKRHFDGIAGTERERVLREQGHRSRPEGENQILFNPGGEKDGALAMTLRPHFTRNQALEAMRRYGEESEHTTFVRMLPFLVTREELETKEMLEEAVWEARRENGGKRPEVLDHLLEEKKQILVQKRQEENRFGQMLEKALREEKQTVWDREKKEERRFWEMLEEVLQEETPLRDDTPEDENSEGETSEGETPEAETAGEETPEADSQENFSEKDRKREL